MKERALKVLDELNVSTTLVVTFKRGLNDHSIGGILKNAASHPYVRGVIFQPVYDEGFDVKDHKPEKHAPTTKSGTQPTIRRASRMGR